MPTRLGGGEIIDVRNGTGVLGSNSPEAARFAEAHFHGDFIERADGKMLVCYPTEIDGTQYMMISVASDIKTLLTTHNSAYNPELEYAMATAPNASGYGRPFFLRYPAPPTPEGEPPDPDWILLFVYERAAVENQDQSAKVYRSLNGLGTDFQLIHTFFTEERDTVAPYGHDGDIIQPIITHTGRIVVGYFRRGRKYETLNPTEFVNYPKIAYSDNRGVSWTEPDYTVYGGTFGAYGGSAGGIAAFGDQLAFVHSNYAGGWSWLNFTISKDNGTTWSFTHGGEFPSRSISDYHTYLWQGQDARTRQPTEWNYMNWTLGLGTGGDGPAGVYRRHVSSPLPPGEPSLDGWEGPINILVGAPGRLWRYHSTLYDALSARPDDPIHIWGRAISGGSAYPGKSVFVIKMVQEFKVAIADIQHKEIRSTRPFICMFIVYANALNEADRLHFKLESSIDEADSQLNPERFGYSMDGGATIIQFPADGVPAVNWMNLLVYSDIQVEPRDRATLTPYCKVMAGFDDGASNWWQLDFDKDRPDWTSLGRDDDGPQWEPIFEHEATGLPEEE